MTGGSGVSLHFRCQFFLKNVFIYSWRALEDLQIRTIGPALGDAIESVLLRSVCMRKKIMFFYQFVSSMLPLSAAAEKVSAFQGHLLIFSQSIILMLPSKEQP